MAQGTSSRRADGPPSGNIVELPATSAVAPTDELEVAIGQQAPEHQDAEPEEAAQGFLEFWPTVFALAGVLVVEAAVTYKPAKAGGIDKALLTLRNQPFGEFLLGLAALGLIIFGVYALCEARWRKV
jgi:hypothetical protein